VNYVVRHWSFDPFIIGVVITVLAHELGLSRLRAHSAPERVRRRRRRSLLFYSGLAVLLVAVVSPIDYWSSDYFFVHMIEHVLIAFAAPVLIVAGAPWIPMMFALPVKTRRKVGRYFYLSVRARIFRAVGRFVRDPWVAVLSFNAAMLVWHVPRLFTLSENNQAVHIWLMHGSFIVTGVLFWLQIIPSYPMRPAKSAIWQAGAIITTDVTMTVLAISMSFLTAVSWYPTYAHLAGVTLSPFADQQIGAAILWVCGDFWALPALYVVLRRAIDQDGSLSSVFDRMTGRGASPTLEQFRPSRVADSTLPKSP
jgi:cytochrome c oxidase assembly factor CtaG